ncbi:hypothetical protein [Ralstonia sp. NFACC01]|jgi:hypothetical protein|uniref:hypothetical protein n=1 Tax=unclassified Ralstonia TaxID=209769 RepID=UPI0008E171C0|nr:hypothetical protein [Ralstonia sp. NFACC01]SFQ10136.1 hypothetical protein SAMN03159417_04220 [Ralstonia sp. NFACC01]
MSNNGDLKQEGPPTLFNSESETDEAGHTRILASLEGRVAASGKAPKKSGQRYGVAAAVVVLAAGIGAWIMLNPSGEPAPAQMAEQAAPAAAQPAAATQAAPAEATHTAAAAPVASASEPVAEVQAATIVNVPAGEDHATEKSDKAPVASALAKEAHDEAPATHTLAAKSSGTPANTDEGKTATAKLVAKSTNTPFKALQQPTKPKAQSSAKTAKNKKGTLAPDDPDADLLAALLAPQNAANKAANSPTYKGQ